MAPAIATVRQKQLAKRLRELRVGAGLSIAEAADRLLCSQAKISRIETAQRRASLRDVRDLCTMYGVSGTAEAEKLMALAKEARQPGWWQEYDNIDIGPYYDLETMADTITEYETTTIPGYLQTEDYARAVIRGYLPEMEPEVLADRVRVRMKRSELLRRASPPRYLVLLDESALHRHVGGPACMHLQLERVAELAELANITLQVIPYIRGAHMGFDTAFNLLTFDDLAVANDTVFMETPMGYHFLEKPADIARFRETIASLQAIALDPADSIALVKERALRFSELHSGQTENNPRLAG